MQKVIVSWQQLACHRVSEDLEAKPLLRSPVLVKKVCFMLSVGSSSELSADPGLTPY